MTNDEYRDAVAAKLGWVRYQNWYDKEGQPTYDNALGATRDQEDAYAYTDFLCDEFNPATDWASAGVWIHWLRSQGYDITFRYAYTPESSPIYVGCKIEHHRRLELYYDDVPGDSELLALKAASEQFLEREK